MASVLDALARFVSSANRLVLPTISEAIVGATSRVISNNVQIGVRDSTNDSMALDASLGEVFLSPHID